MHPSFRDNKMQRLELTYDEISYSVYCVLTCIGPPHKFGTVLSSSGFISWGNWGTKRWNNFYAIKQLKETGLGSKLGTDSRAL